MKRYDYDRVLERSNFKNKVDVPKLDRVEQLMGDVVTRKPIYEQRGVTTMVPNIDLLLKHELTLKSKPHKIC